MLTLVHVLEWRAAGWPDQVALSDDRDAVLTYAALLAATEASAGAFAAAGVGPGDVRHEPKTAADRTGVRV